jgi:Na+-transporting NADH:ubiquinone oxidoreductase subunit NqrB
MEPCAAPHCRSLADPRHYQIAVLAALLLFGMCRLEFDIPWAHICATLAAALIAQRACTWLSRQPRFDPRSALISGLSLCLLLRTDSYRVLIAAAMIAITSKFVLRYHGKHVFNPSNLAVTLCVALDGAWLSPAQWGSATWIAFALACLGGLVVSRAERADITVSFLVCYVGLLFARAFWLGDPSAIPFRQMQSGTLLLFAFFMISDPRTTPADSRARVLLAALLAVTAFVLRFQFYSPNALIYALALLSPLTIVLDRVFPGSTYRWPLDFPRGVLQ